MPAIKILCVSASAAALLAVSIPLTAKADAQPELIIENFVGTINWVNGTGEISLIKQKNARRLDLQSGDGSLIINGGIEDPDGNDCKGYYGSYDISLFGDKKRNSGKFGGYKDLEDFPILDLEIPRNTSLIIRNAIIFSEGSPDIAAADLDLQHCGKVNLGDVAGPLLLESRGSADVTLGDAEEIDAELRGSGDLEANKVGDFTFKARGSGDVEIEQAVNVMLTLSGSGDAEIGDISGDATLSSSGSGDIDLGLVKGDLDYKGAGSGDLSVDEVRGTGDNIVDLQASGSSDISIDESKISFLTISASGSVNVNVDGIITDADVRASGSSDIYLDTVTGDIRQKASGSSDIHIDHRD